MCAVIDKWTNLIKCKSGPVCTPCYSLTGSHRKLFGQRVCSAKGKIVHVSFILFLLIKLGIDSSPSLNCIFETRAHVRCCA